MFSKKEIILIIFKHLVLKIGVVIAVAVMVIIFLKGQILKVSNSTEEQRVLVSVLANKNETLASLKNDFEKIGGTEDRIKNSLPPADNILDFVASMEDLAKRNSVEQSLSFSSPENFIINYNINISGNINSVINYLRDFEKQPYFASISGMSLSAPSGDWQSSLSASMTAKVHVK